LTSPGFWQKGRDFCLTVAFFWLMALVCGGTVHSLGAAGLRWPQTPGGSPDFAWQTITRRQNWELMLKYVNGLAEATANLERFPGQGGFRELEPVAVIAGQLSARLWVERLAVENGWFVVELGGSADAAQKLYLLLNRDPSFDRVEYEQQPAASAVGHFVIRCELKDDQGVMG
jgi:hypothetical protein